MAAAVEASAGDATSSGGSELQPMTLLPGRTAFLIIHGVGQQNKFETLSRFAAGLKIGIEDAFPGGAATVERKLTRLGARNETYLSIGLPDADAGEIDVYEFYYQPLLQRQVSVEDVVAWLLQTAKRIRMLYREDAYLRSRLLQGGTAADGTGDRLERGYMLAPAARLLPFVIAGISWLIDLLKGVSASKWPLGPFRWLADLLIGFAYRVIAQRLDNLITEFAGDVTAYTAIDPKARLNNVRTAILAGCQQQIRDLLNKTAAPRNGGETPYYDRLVVAGHSLGTVVAYDALSWISNDLAAGAGDYPADGGARLRGLVTFGSPLDKIALFFWPLSQEQMRRRRGAAGDRAQPAGKQDYADKSADFQVGMLDYFHGMRGMRQSVADYPSEVVQPTARPLQHVTWLNFFHPRDAVAGHLDAYAGVKNLRRFAGSPDVPGFPESHSYYWYDPGLYDCLLRTFASAGGILPGDGPQALLAKLSEIERSYNQ